MKKIKIKYYVREDHDIKEQLRNGSFLRESTFIKTKLLARYILGDFDIYLDQMPEGYIEVTSDEDKQVIPKCCK